MKYLPILIPPIATYLFSVFVCLEWDIRLWTEFGRFVFAYVTASASGLIGFKIYLG